MSMFCDYLSSEILIHSIPWDEPLPVQKRSMEHIHSGKNVFIRARTGSGKTAAFALPILDRMLTQDDIRRAVFLAPTRELTNQIKCVLNALLDGLLSAKYEIRLIDLNASNEGYESSQKELLIGTPARFASFLKTNKNRLVDVLVIDEADLVIGMELDRDLKKIIESCGRPNQLILVSATLDKKGSEEFAEMITGGPSAAVHVCQKQSLPEQLEQFRIDCNEDQDKYVLLVALLKLGILQPPPMIVFTSSTNRSYRLRLVLERFGLKCLTLNAELPRECQMHTVDQFNRGVVDLLICTDQRGDRGHVCPRGLDFRSLTYVINFDCPSTVTEYVHRVGRACRLDDNGAALTLVCTEQEHKAISDIEAKLKDLKIFAYPREEVSAFQYRVRDSLQMASKAAIRRTRAQELRTEMIANEKLARSYWAGNLRELELLKDSSRRVHPLLTSSHQKVFKHVPSYMVPKHLNVVTSTSKRRVVKKKKRFSGGHSKRSCDPMMNPKRALKKMKDGTV
ncbi:hypothetical protein ACOME3_004872 [Neoechinorhynchus agilis]